MSNPFANDLFNRGGRAAASPNRKVPIVGGGASGGTRSSPAIGGGLRGGRQANSLFGGGQGTVRLADTPQSRGAFGGSAQKTLAARGGGNGEGAIETSPHLLHDAANKLTRPIYCMCINIFYCI